MKVRLLIPQQVKNPKYSDQVHRHLVQQGRSYGQQKWVWKPAGHEIDADDPSNASDKGLWKLVCKGSCEAADQECRDRVVEYFKSYPERYGDVTDWASVQPLLELARRDNKKTLKGIHPEDYDKFEMGEIAGYAPDGSFILGPNGMPLEFNDPPEDT